LLRNIIGAFFQRFKECEIKPYCSTSGYYLIQEQLLRIKYYSHHPLTVDVIVKRHYYNHVCSNANRFVTKHILLTQHDNITTLRCYYRVPSGTLAPLTGTTGTTGTLGTRFTRNSFVITVRMSDKLQVPWELESLVSPWLPRFV
jgi:hypothetical protein